MNMPEGRSTLIEMLGDAPKLRVIDFFLTFSRSAHTKTQVAHETGVSRTTIGPIWKEIIKQGLIVRSDQHGRSEFYRLNRPDPRVRAMIEADRRLSRLVAEAEMKQAVHTKQLHILRTQKFVPMAEV
jgi:biotin operon repressor